MAIRKDVDYPGRWEAATPEYPMGKPKNRTTSTSKDGSYLEKKWIQDYEAFLGALLNEAGISPNGAVDTAVTSQFFTAISSLMQAIPINGDWNGYLDPAHQEQIPSANGYPANSVSGGSIYSTGDEWSINCFSGTSNNTISSDDDGVIFSGSIYKQYEYSIDQINLIDVDSLSVFIKDQSGAEYFFKNGDDGVLVEKLGTSIKVTLSSQIFSGSINKVWRFFVTERVGRVLEIDPIALANNLRAEVENKLRVEDVTPSRSQGTLYTNTSNFNIRLYIECESVNLTSALFVDYEHDGRILQYALNETTTGQPARVVIMDTIRPGETYKISGTGVASFTIPQWFEDVI